jgi:hypothetical protein
MIKKDLLLSMGFSKEYLDFLEKLDECDNYNFEQFDDYYISCSFDMTNIILEESKTNFVTKLKFQTI